MLTYHLLNLAWDRVIKHLKKTKSLGTYRGSLLEETCLHLFLCAGSGAVGSRLSFLSLNHSIRCRYNSSWQKEILARSWLRAEWCMAAMLNKLQSVTPSCCWNGTAVTGRTPFLIAGWYICTVCTCFHYLAIFHGQEMNCCKASLPHGSRGIPVMSFWNKQNLNNYVCMGRCVSFYLTGMCGSFSRLRIVSTSIYIRGRGERGVIEFTRLSNPLLHWYIVGRLLGS